MKNLFLLTAFLIFFATAEAQELSLFGPRAGIGNLTDSKNTKIKDGIHSAFGWQVEIPYSGKDITGYGEAGIYFLGAEQGIIYPHVWGYFGFRTRSFGLGIGPVINPLGVGLGFSPYTQIELETLRIPIGVDINLIKGTTRFQVFIGFNYK